MRLYKQRDQHILVDRSILRRIVDYSELSDDEVALEIGCGPGNLTAELLKRAKKVIGVEKDPRMVNLLKKKFSKEIEDGRFEIVQDDALKVSFPKFDKFVSNIPYSISSPLTFKLLKHDFRLAIVMYQKEFAERLTAQPGSKKYGRLSITSRVFCRAEILEIVSRKAFKPPPKVDSAIVRLTPSSELKIIDFDLFVDLVRFSFSMRRKKFGKIFQSWCEKRKIKPNEILKELGLEEYIEKRPEEIEPEVFAKLTNGISEIGGSA
ncbi:ribosomal RNA small subunit methyltransferase A [Archaeoglobales archaeon]|nr:MAG: ribosomal RNA small subunit methyltransferase A [Archaeoglobales archaeon]